jgi:hypothetical protein
LVPEVVRSIPTRLTTVLSLEPFGRLDERVVRVVETTQRLQE